jgi:UDPglucose--hexose-1-phosphate uridylyltransferase
MSELRFDPIQRRWVIIATDRARRPTDFVPEAEPRESKFCPFCPGSEDKTPPEIFAFRENGTEANRPGWQLRAFSNKFPALDIKAEAERHGMGRYDMMSGVGAHEVIVETPDHYAHFAEMPLEAVHLVLRAWQSRLNELLKDGRLKYVVIFKNHGHLAGASLAHPHSQIIATPVVPRTVSMELTAAKEHFAEKERCIFCDIIFEEREKQVRVIHENDDFVAITPYASRFPFEIFLAPRQHAHNFGEVADEQLLSLAGFLKSILARLKTALNDPPFNLIMHTAPNTHTTLQRSGFWETLREDWHWHLEIIPRLTRIAGFEWGTGFYINPTPPEDAARALRELPEL